MSDEIIANGISNRQRLLMDRSGTPAGFAVAVYELVPGSISMEEARAAIDRYQQEWDDAADEREHQS